MRINKIYKVISWPLLCVEIPLGVVEQFGGGMPTKHLSRLLTENFLWTGSTSMIAVYRCTCSLYIVGRVLRILRRPSRAPPVLLKPCRPAKVKVPIMKTERPTSGHWVGNPNLKTHAHPWKKTHCGTRPSYIVWGVVEDTIAAAGSYSCSRSPWLSRSAIVPGDTRKDLPGLPVDSREDGIQVYAMANNSPKIWRHCFCDRSPWYQDPRTRFRLRTHPEVARCPAVQSCRRPEVIVTDSVCSSPPLSVLRHQDTQFRSFGSEMGALRWLGFLVLAALLCVNQAQAADSTSVSVPDCGVSPVPYPMRS